MSFSAQFNVAQSKVHCICLSSYVLTMATCWPAICWQHNACRLQFFLGLFLWLVRSEETVFCCDAAHAKACACQGGAQGILGGLTKCHKRILSDLCVGIMGQPAEGVNRANAGLAHMQQRNGQRNRSPTAQPQRNVIFSQMCVSQQSCVLFICKARAGWAYGFPPSPFPGISWANSFYLCKAKHPQMPHCSQGDEGKSQLQEMTG